MARAVTSTSTETADSGPADPEPASPGSTKGARTRLRILDAAARVLREKGYAATRLSDIAEVAGLQTGSLAFHFPAKGRLLDEVVRHGLAVGLAQVRDAAERLGPDASPTARIIAAIHAHLDGLDDRNDFAPAILRLVDQFPPEARHRLRDVDRAYVAQWHGLLEDARLAGAMPADTDTALLTRLILGAMNATLGRTDTGPRERLVTAVLAMLRLGEPSLPEEHST
ncbi:MAG TPA: TetR family transcriptional regulator [Pseudonocardia sp.]|nr:TetR family transcriptional regulator [Pseudonocardia sp.]